MISKYPNKIINSRAEGKNTITDSLREKLYYQMVLVRLFEERILDLFSRGELSGTAHCYIGQEANAVAAINNLQGNDIIVSNHRCHGHYLAYTEDVFGLMSELMGRVDGVCGGRGGSQHLCKNNFFSNGIQGNMAPVAAGMAFAEKIKKTGAVTLLFVGYGPFGQGTVYETLNMISLWELPILVVVENNYYAQTTPMALNFSGTFLGRAESFALSAAEITSNDAEELFYLFKEVIKKVRHEGRPYVQVVNTYRLCAHSKGDDFRPKAEIESWMDKDPLKILGVRLSEEIKSGLQMKAQERIKQNLSRLT